MCSGGFDHRFTKFQRTSLLECHASLDLKFDMGMCYGLAISGPEFQNFKLKYMGKKIIYCERKFPFMA